MLAESALLLVPIHVAKRRPIPRHRWTALAVVAGGLFVALLEGIFQDRLPGDPFESESTKGLVLAGVALVSWGVWGTLFWPCSRRGSPESGLKRTIRILLAGSTVELLVAVPCHVIAVRAGIGRERLWGLAAVVAAYLSEGVFFAAWCQFSGH